MERILLLSIFGFELLAFIIVIYSGHYLGDPRPKTNFVSLSENFLLLISYLFFVKLIFSLFVNKKKVGKESENYLLNILVFSLIILNICGNLMFGIGNAIRTGEGLFLFSILPVNHLFYMTLLYNPNGKMMKLNSSLYILLKLMQGWTGFIYEFTIILFFKYSKKIKIRTFIMFGPVIILLYKLLYGIRSYVRYGEFHNKNIVVLAFQIVGRMTIFSNNSFIYDNSRKLLEVSSDGIQRFYYVYHWLNGILPENLVVALIGKRMLREEGIFQTFIHPSRYGTAEMSIISNLLLSFQKDKLIVFEYISLIVISFTIIFLLNKIIKNKGIFFYTLFMILNFLKVGSIHILSSYIYALMVFCIISKIKIKRINEYMI